MLELQANLWTLIPKIYCITTNGIVKQSGKAIMGAGIAKQALDLFPHCDIKLGDLIKEKGNIVHIFYTDIDTTLISFPTKYHWKDKSCIDLIKQSALCLKVLMDFYNFKKVYLPRPGCDNGGLLWQDVKQEIEPILDDRVTVVYI